MDSHKGGTVRPIIGSVVFSAIIAAMLAVGIFLVIVSIVVWWPETGLVNVMFTLLFLLFFVLPGLAGARFLLTRGRKYRQVRAAIRAGRIGVARLEDSKVKRSVDSNGYERASHQTTYSVFLDNGVRYSNTYDGAEALKGLELRLEKSKASLVVQLDPSSPEIRTERQLGILTPRAQEAWRAAANARSARIDGEGKPPGWYSSQGAMPLNRPYLDVSDEDRNRLAQLLAVPFSLAATRLVSFVTVFVLVFGGLWWVAGPKQVAQVYSAQRLAEALTALEEHHGVSEATSIYFRGNTVDATMPITPGDSRFNDYTYHFFGPIGWVSDNGPTLIQPDSDDARISLKDIDPEILAQVILRAPQDAGMPGLRRAGAPYIFMAWDLVEERGELVKRYEAVIDVSLEDDYTDVAVRYSLNGELREVSKS